MNFIQLFIFLISFSYSFPTDSFHIPSDVNNSSLALENGFWFTVECLNEDYSFCNKVKKDVIISGIKISQEISIFVPINVKVLVYSFGSKNKSFYLLIERFGSLQYSIIFS